jgi:hypothetical protein
MQALHINDSEFSSLPTLKARDHQAEGYEAGLRRATPQLGTIVKGIVDKDERVMLPTPRASEPGSTSVGYGDSLNDFASRVVNGYAKKDIELLRSPTASQGQGGALGEAEARRRGNTVGIRDQAMDIAKAQGLKVSRSADNLFPTPVASEGTKAPSQQTSATKSKTGQVWLSNVAKDLQPLLPTVTAVDGNTVAKSELDNNDPKHRLKVQSQVLARDNSGWGKFEPAIKRWEAIIGRPAPEPTKPDGKDGNHRLSSKFTEWMMGLPDGWITDIGLKRNDELKACGNGVVPQQAELALSLLGVKEILERN